MQYLFEYCDTIESPYEAFLYDTSYMAFPIRPHWHYFMEIIYMLEGTGLIECNGKSYVVEAGDMILFHPEMVHAIYTATNVPLRLHMEAVKERNEEKNTENPPRSHADKHHTDPRLKSCRSVLRRPEFVPETMNIDDLFHSMQSKHLQIVLVADEYGQTVGLVTMEDILEEIVGNIQDEYDEEDRFVVKTGKDRFVADGMTPLDELEQLLDISFDEDLEVDTLNGFMIMKMEHIPEEKERFSMEYAGYEFQIRKVEKRVIRSVLIIKREVQPVEKEVEEMAE